MGDSGLASAAVFRDFLVSAVVCVANALGLAARGFSCGEGLLTTTVPFWTLALVIFGVLGETSSLTWALRVALVFFGLGFGVDAVSGSFRFLIALGFGLLTGDFLVTINVTARFFVFDTGGKAFKTSFLRDLVILVGTGLASLASAGLGHFTSAGLAFLVAFELFILDLVPLCLPLVLGGLVSLVSTVLATLSLPRVLFGEGFTMSTVFVTSSFLVLCFLCCGSVVSSARGEDLKNELHD